MMSLSVQLPELGVWIGSVLFEYGIFDVLCLNVHYLWDTMRYGCVPTTHAGHENKAQSVCFRVCFNMKGGLCHIFILRELNFHTNSQCSRMCKGRLNTMHHPWFPWRLWSLYDNRIPTIAAKTLIPAWSKKIMTRKLRWGIWLRDDEQPGGEMLCGWGSLRGRTSVSLFTAAAARWTTKAVV